MAWRYSEEAKAIADRLIAELPEFEALRGLPIRYALNSEPMKSMGKRIWGRAKKATAITPFFAGAGQPFYYVELDQQVWLDVLTDFQKEALIHHELCHFSGQDDETGDLGMVDHDIEEFNLTYARYGAWHSGIERFLRKDVQTEAETEAPPVAEASNGKGKSHAADPCPTCRKYHPESVACEEPNQTDEVEAEAASRVRAAGSRKRLPRPA